MRILIVDDSPATLAIVHRGIERMGYDDISIKKAQDGQIALNIVREWEPNLIISDWHMPEMTGIELLSELQGEMLGIDFGFITTEASEERLQEARDKGAKFIIQKPFDNETLETTVQPFIDSHRQSSASQTNEQPQAESTEAEKKIILPHIDALQIHLNKLTELRITVTKAPHIIMDSSLFPYIIGLYGQADKASVHAVVVADIKAIAILCRLAGGLPMDDMQKVLNKRVTKAALNKSQDVLEHIESILFNMSSNTSLALRDAKIVKEPAAHIQKLLDENNGDRLDTWLSMPGYKPGCLTIIVS